MILPDSKRTMLIIILHQSDFHNRKLHLSDLQQISNFKRLSNRVLWVYICSQDLFCRASKFQKRLVCELHPSRDWGQDTNMNRLIHLQISSSCWSRQLLGSKFGLMMLHVSKQATSRYFVGTCGTRKVFMLQYLPVCDTNSAIKY